MTDTFTLPPPPDANKVSQWTGQIRAVAILLAGLGMGGLNGWLGGVSDQQLGVDLTRLMDAADLLIAGGTMIWSWLEKTWIERRARAITVASASASAALGQPVVVTVTPAGQPNAVTQVSAAEVAAAPSVPNVEPSPPPKG